MAASARQSCRPVKPAGGKAAWTPGSSVPDTPSERGCPQVLWAHCCCVGGDADSGVRGAGGTWETIERKKDGKETRGNIDHLLVPKSRPCEGSFGSLCPYLVLLIVTF